MRSPFVFTASVDFKPSNKEDIYTLTCAFISNASETDYDINQWYLYNQEKVLSNLSKQLSASYSKVLDEKAVEFIIYDMAKEITKDAICNTYGVVAPIAGEENPVKGLTSFEVSKLIPITDAHGIQMILCKSHVENDFEWMEVDEAYDDFAEDISEILSEYNAEDFKDENNLDEIEGQISDIVGAETRVFCSTLVGYHHIS